MQSLMLPGYGNSLGDHWQCHWHRQLAHCHWLEQPDWDAPKAEDWIQTLNQAVLNAAEPLVLISHSLGGLTIAQWARQHPELCSRIRGAWLVALPDPEAPAFPAAISGFEPVSAALPFPSHCVISDDDPYASLSRSQHMAQVLGATWECLAGAGHINTSAGFGPWPEGLSRLQHWVAQLG